MFNKIGPLEILLVLVVILLLFGPSRLPDLVRSVGKSIREFRGAVKEENGSDSSASNPESTPRPTEPKSKA